MIRSLEVKNFTAFPEAHLDFAKGLNVIVGENATGKTHLLKLPLCRHGGKRRGRQEA